MKPVLRPATLALVFAALAATGIAGTARAFIQSTRFDYATGAGAYNVTLADLNGDGRPDVIVPCFSANSVSVLLATGGGHLAPRVDFPAGVGPTSVAVGDLNGDGRPDLLVTNQSSNTISIFLGTGNGGFGPRTDVAVGSLPNGVVLGDFNEDGRLDAAVCCQSLGGVTILFGDGTGALGSRKDISTGSTATGIAAADFDGDGHLDLAVANHLSASVTVLHGSGTGGFASPATLIVNSPFGVAAADVNNDGVPDLVATSNVTDSVYVWMGPVGTVVRSSYNIGTNISAIAIGQLHNLADVPDLVVANAGANSVAVMTNNGFSFAGQTLFPVGSGVNGVAVADMDGDGMQDIVSANFSSATVSVLLNNNQSTFAAKTEYPTGGSPWSVALVDLNHDGKLDAIVNDVLEVMLGDGAGGFGPRSSFYGFTSYGIAVADFNGDGNLDIATAEGIEPPGFSLVGVLPGNGAGGFGTRAEYTAGTRPVGVVAADLDFDGFPDLVTANRDANSISILMNTGTGSFGAKSDLAAGTTPNFIATGDLNGDGIPDVVVTNGASNNVSIYLGTGSSLSAQVQASVGAGPNSVAIGDVNGDGKADLVVANGSAGTVSVLIGNGTGTAYARTDLAVGNSPLAVAIRDMDGDGIPDIVVGSQTGGTITILPGLGGGAFGSAIASPFATPLGGMAIGDLNNDGRQDLLLSESITNSLGSVLELEPTRTQLAVNPSPALNNGAVTLTASVSAPAPGKASPGGTVYFYDGFTALGHANVVGGTAALQYFTPRLGARSLWAVYAGDNATRGSVSATVIQRVVATAAARITSTRDITADQGGRVRLDFSPSAFDFLGSPTPIARYDVFRRQLVIGAALARDPRASLAPQDIELAGWDFVASVPANVESEYDLVAPTVVDSNGTGFHWSVFMVRASTSTPGVYYDSPPDSGYSVDNLPPAPPAPFLGAYSGGATHLHWGANTEADFWYYKLYRGASSGFVPGPANFVASLPDTGYQDVGPAGSWYKLAAVDVNGNVSPFSIVGPNGITAVGDSGPAEFALAPPSPNPARGPGLVVRFSLPASRPGRIELLDVSGRRITNRDVGGFGPGEHSIDLADGRMLPPGVYLVRLTCGAESRMVRAAVLE